jgi:hypothetical protein
MPNAFLPAWFRERCFVLQQRGASAFQRLWGAADPAGSKALRTIKDTSKKTFKRLRAIPWRAVALRYRPLLVGLGVLVLLFIIWKVPQWQAARWEGRIEPKEVAKQESDTRTTVVQALAGAVLFIGLYFTAKTLKTTQEGQITDRFTKAINQLGETGPEKLAIRLGGIYAPERIARDSERDHWPIMEILTAYVREHAPWKAEGQHSQPKLAPDIQAILTVLGRRTRSYGKGEDWPLDLSFTDLRRAALTDAHLERGSLGNPFGGRSPLILPLRGCAPPASLPGRSKAYKDQPEGGKSLENLSRKNIPLGNAPGRSHRPNI